MHLAANATTGIADGAGWATTPPMIPPGVFCFAFEKVFLIFVLKTNAIFFVKCTVFQGAKLSSFAPHVSRF